MSLVDRKIRGIPIPDVLPPPFLVELNKYSSPSTPLKRETSDFSVDDLLAHLKKATVDPKAHNHDHSILFLVSQQTRRLGMLIGGITDAARSYFTFKDIRCPSEDDQYEGQSLAEIKR
jgi:hypothetical protein